MYNGVWKVIASNSVEQDQTSAYYLGKQGSNHGPLVATPITLARKIIVLRCVGNHNTKVGLINLALNV